MDLYTAMQYLTMASCCALAVAVMMLFVDRPSPAKPDQWFGDARSLAGVGGVLAILCALPAFAVGVRLFGLAEVLTTLRTMGPVLLIAGGGWVGLMLLVLSSERLG